MNKRIKKAIAILLSVIITFSFSVTGFAAEESGEAKPYTPLAHFVDGVFGLIHDALFKTLESINKLNDIPTYDEFMSGDNGYYKGTDGRTEGEGWSGGFASQSIIPKEWRGNALFGKGAQDYRLDSYHTIGGYQGIVDKIYTDQTLNMIMLSNGTDSNANGVDDVIIFASADGVGITAGTCRLMRQQAEEALKAKGVEKDDILSFNISATHCHSALDIQGMSIVRIIMQVLNNAVRLTGNYRTLNKTMEKTLCEKAALCAVNAYESMENGSFYYFETGKVNGASDKHHSGVLPKNYFSCFLFEGESGEKSLITNIAAHPVGYDSFDYGFMMSADYPAYLALALKDAGYNIVFTQSAQASVSSAGIDCEEGSQIDIESNEWVSKYALTKEEFTERYGKIYADRYYDEFEPEMEGDLKGGYRLAHYIIDASENKQEIAPVLNAKNSQALMPLDNGLLCWGSVSGLLGENVVSMKDSESGYGLVVELNYFEIGNDISVFTAPGELSPGLVYGSDPNYDGNNFWNGELSWSGETWQYDTLENLVREATGDDDRIVLVFGITNDAIGYIYPDNNTTKSLLGIALFFRYNADGMMNDMLLTTGQRAGSSVMDSYIDILETIYG